MYRPWENGRQSSVQASNAYPVYQEYTPNRRGERRRNGRGRSPLAVLRLGKNCGQMEDPYCDDYGYDELPPPYTTFNGYIHVKSLTLLKLVLLILWLTRECQLQMVEQICRNGNSTHPQFRTCTRSPCAWTYMLMGGMPHALQIDALCNALVLMTLMGVLLFLGALWLRERQLFSLRPPPSTLLKSILIALQSFLEFAFLIGIAYQLVVNISKRHGGEAVWCVVKGIIVMSIILANFFLHVMTSLYICDRGHSIDYGKESHGFRDDRRRRVDDYEDDIAMNGRRDEHEQAFARQTNLHGMPLMGAVPPNHMTQLPPGSSNVYHAHSGTASPAYYNEACVKSSSSEDSGGVSSVGYGRLRQALRQQAKASRAAGGGGHGGHHLLMQNQQPPGVSPHLHLPSSSSRPDLAAMAASASAASIAASSIAGVAPPPVLLSPQAAALAAAAAPYIIEEAAGDYSHVRSLRQAELMRQSAVARSRKNSPAPPHHRRSREGLLLSPSEARLHAADTRPESAYLEVI